MFFPSLLGFPGKIGFSGTPDPGWHWKYSAQCNPIPIGPGTLRLKKRRLCLVCDKKTLPVFEHIGALQWMGLTDLMLHTDWRPLPYFGSVGEIWNLIKPYLVESERDVTYFTVRNSVKFVYPQSRGGKTSFTSIAPSKDDRLTIRVEVSFKGVGSYFGIYSFPDMATLAKVFAARTPALPRWLRFIARPFPGFLWNHYPSVRWFKRGEDPQAFLEEVALHRVQDILGALSVLNHDRKLLSANILSVCSGHRADYEVVCNPFRWEIPSIPRTEGLLVSAIKT